MNPYLEVGFSLRCFQRLSIPNIATQLAFGKTAGTPEVSPPRSSRTRGRSSQDSTPAVDNNQPVSRIPFHILLYVWTITYSTLKVVLAFSLYGLKF